MTTTIKLRRDTSANWTSSNPILAAGEPGLETDTLKVKYGDGVTNWVNLNYSAVGNAAYANAAGTATTATTAVTAATATSANTALVAGTVTTNAQPNITSVGTLSSLVASGNISGSNLNISGGATLGNVASANYFVGDLHGTANVAQVAATVTSNAQPNITSVGILTGVVSTGNITTTGFFVGDGGFLTNVASGSSYSNANVATYLPTYDGNVLGLTVTNTTNSTSSTTGALKVAGGIGAAGNIHSGGEIHSFGNIDCAGDTVFIGPFADATGIVEPIIVGFRGGEQYTQAVIKNSLGNGSADWTAFANEGTEDQGWISQGIAGSSFNDPNYTVTAPGDSYLFGKGLLGSGGNLVLGTGGTGTKNDIVFATGGFLSNNEFARIDHANSALHLTKVGSKIKFQDGTSQNTAWTGTIDTGNVSGLGNISTVNLDGNSSNVLYGNGTFASVAAGTYGDSNVANYLPTYTGTVNTSNITFVANSTIESTANSSGDGNGYTTLVITPDSSLVSNDQYLVIDPTAPTHIHIRAGGTQDASNAELYLGGEKNNVRVIDGTGVRLYNEVRNDVFSYFSDPSDFNTATWYGTPGNYFVEFTEVTAGMGDLAFAFGNDAENRVTVYYGAGETSVLTYGGSTSNLGGGVYRFAVVEAPPASPTALTAIEFQIWTTNNNRVELQNDDFTVEVNDDVRITGNNLFSLRNTSPTDPITIRTDYDGADRVWEFAANGTLGTPGDIVVNGDVTGTIGGSTLVLRAEPGSNTAIQLNDIVDSEIRTVANLVIRTDVSNTPYAWTFGTDGNLTLPGNTLAINFADNSSAFGNIVSVNLDGNVSNVLTGDGSFVALPTIDANTVVWTTAPVANNSTGTAGQIAYDSGGNLYVCVATDTWAKFTGSTSW